eukprot:15482986-Alexandrium_andersonii.AAC.1
MGGASRTTPASTTGSSPASRQAARACSRRRRPSGAEATRRQRGQPTLAADQALPCGSARFGPA